MYESVVSTSCIDDEVELYESEWSALHVLMMRWNDVCISGQHFMY